MDANGSDASGSTGGSSFERRRSMTEREETERRASIQAIMRDPTLTPMERRGSIQRLMDGRTTSLSQSTTQQRGHKMEAIATCPVLDEDFDDDPSIADKSSSHLPVQSARCAHRICYSCVMRMKMQKAVQLNKNPCDIKWLACPVCREKTCFNTEDPVVDLGRCEALKVLRANTATLQLFERDIATKDAAIEEKDAAIVKKDAEIEEKVVAIIEKDNVIAELERKNKDESEEEDYLSASAKDAVGLNGAIARLLKSDRETTLDGVLKNEDDAALNRLVSASKQLQSFGKTLKRSAEREMKDRRKRKREAAKAVKTKEQDSIKRAKETMRPKILGKGCHRCEDQLSRRGGYTLCAGFGTATSSSASCCHGNALCKSCYNVMENDGTLEKCSNCNDFLCDDCIYESSNEFVCEFDCCDEFHRICCKCDTDGKAYQRCRFCRRFACRLCMDQALTFEKYCCSCCGVEEGYWFCKCKDEDERETLCGCWGDCGQQVCEKCATYPDYWGEEEVRYCKQCYEKKYARGCER